MQCNREYAINTSDSEKNEQACSEAEDLQNEIKGWLLLSGASESSLQGFLGKEYDASNLATVINYFHCVGLITDIEKIKLRHICE